MYFGRGWEVNERGKGSQRKKMVSATEKLWSKRGPSAVGGHSSGNLRSEDGYRRKRQK